MCVHVVGVVVVCVKNNRKAIFRGQEGGGEERLLTDRSMKQSALLLEVYFSDEDLPVGYGEVFFDFRFSSTVLFLIKWKI